MKKSFEIHQFSIIKNYQFTVLLSACLLTNTRRVSSWRRWGQLEIWTSFLPFINVGVCPSTHKGHVGCRCSWLWVFFSSYQLYQYLQCIYFSILLVNNNDEYYQVFIFTNICSNVCMPVWILILKFETYFNLFFFCHLLTKIRGVSSWRRWGQLEIWTSFLLFI